MNSNKTFITLGIVVAILALGIAYAAIANQTVVVNTTATTATDDANFDVDIISAQVTTPATHGSASTNVVDDTDDNVATFTIDGFTTEGDTATATYTIKNASTANVKAALTANTTNSNEEWFDVEHTLTPASIEKGQSATLTVTVTLLKTPVDSTPSATFTTTVTADPSEGTVQQQS